MSQRRNDVAHGVENIELLNITILKEYIKYISSYCKSIFEILLNKSLGYVFNEQPENFEKINVINNSIVCGVIQDLAFSKSDFVLIEKPDTNRPKYVLSKIDDIQINNVSHDKLTITDKKLVGIKVSDYCKNNYMFKIITAPNTQYT